MHGTQRKALARKPEVIERQAETFFPGYVRSPLEERSRACNVRASRSRIIPRQRTRSNLAPAAGERANLLGKLQDRYLIGIAEVHRAADVSHQKSVQSLYQV